MSSARTSLKRSLTAIARAFTDIESTLAGLSRRVRAAERHVARRVVGTRTRRRRIKLTPQRRAQLKLQGAYMGFMRQLKPAQKKRVKAVKEKRGLEAAIALAKQIAKR